MPSCCFHWPVWQQKWKLFKAFHCDVELMLLEPDLTFLPQKRLRLTCPSTTSLGFTRLIKTVNTSRAGPLSHTIYIGIHILSSPWSCQCLDHVLPRALWPSQGQVTAYPTEHWISPHLRKDNSPQWPVGCRVRVWRTFVRTPSPNLSILIPCAPWETRPACGTLETFPGGLWLSQLLPLFLMVPGVTSHRDQCYVWRQKELLFCSTAQCRSHSRWERRASLKRLRSCAHFTSSLNPPR